MPYVRPEEPFHLYSYLTKGGRWRTSPAYFNMPYGNWGYENYKRHMDSWLRMEKNMYIPSKIVYPNGKVRITKWKYDPNNPYQPVYWSYPEYLKKAKKYALIKRRIYLNKQKALAKRRAMRK